MLVARLDDLHASDESEWILVDTAASHPFWSRDGRVLYYLPTTPTIDMRNKVVARAFDPRDGRVGAEPIDVLTLSETIVPAMVSASAPIVAGDQIDSVARELPRRRLDDEPAGVVMTALSLTSRQDVQNLHTLGEATSCDAGSSLVW